jgi:trigger factor
MSAFTASRSKLKRALLDALAEHYTFAVPPGMVDMEFDQIWHQLEHDLEHQGKTVADMDKPEEEAKAEYRAIAERRVRLGLLLSEVGRVNNLEVNEDEVGRAVVEQARRFPGQEQQVFEYLRNNPEAQAQLRAPILEDKVCDFIFEMADVTDKPVSVDELMAAVEADAEEDGHHHHGHDHDHNHDHDHRHD